MGLRDRVVIPERTDSQAVFLDEPGLYELEVLSLGTFESQKTGDEYWKLSAVIVDREETPPKGYKGPYSPLDINTEIVVIHNLDRKDKWGFFKKERQAIEALVGGPDEAAGQRIVVEVYEKTAKKGVINVRAWYPASEADLIEEAQMPF